MRFVLLNSVTLAYLAMASNDCWERGSRYMGNFSNNDWAHSCKEWKDLEGDYAWDALKTKFGDTSIGQHKFCRTDGSEHPWCVEVSVWKVSKKLPCTGLPVCGDNSDMSTTTEQSTTTSPSKWGIHDIMHDPFTETPKTRRTVHVPFPETPKTRIQSPLAKKKQYSINSTRFNLHTRNTARHYTTIRTKTISGNNTVPKSISVQDSQGPRNEVEPTTLLLDCDSIDYFDAVYYKGRLYGKQNRFITACLGENTNRKASNIAIGVAIVYVWNAVIFIIVIKWMFQAYIKCKRFQNQRRHKPQFNSWELHNSNVYEL